MNMEQDPDSKWIVTEILPDNPRTQEIIKKREERDEQIRKEQNDLRQRLEQEEKRKKQKEKSEQAERARREKQAKDNEARKKELEEEQNKLEGKLAFMLLDLQENTTPFDFTLSGVNLGSKRC